MVPFETVEAIAPDSTVLVRIDLNAPVDDSGSVVDTRRFDRHAASVDTLAAAGHRVVCLAHQGRPGGDAFLSLAQHAALLDAKTAAPVGFVDAVTEPRALAAIDALAAGEALLLENVRMHPDELPEAAPAAKAETDLVETLAAAVDWYVDDAYSVAHRSHASIVGFPLRLPACGGPVMATEYAANTAIADRSFDGPVVMVLGGTKATDVIGVMRALADRVDRFCLGGVAAELFLRAAGAPVGVDADGGDRFRTQWAQTADEIAAVRAALDAEVLLPTDLAYADAAGERAEVAVDAIAEKTTSYLDIGTATAERYAAVCAPAAAVFVKGALGVFEDPRFATGTVTVLEAIAAGDAYSVVGGGDTSRAVPLYDLDPAAFDHLSIAGGAYLTALSGAPLVGVEVLPPATTAP